MGDDDDEVMIDVPVKYQLDNPIVNTVKKKEEKKKPLVKASSP